MQSLLMPKQRRIQRNS